MTRNKKSRTESGFGATPTAAVNKQNASRTDKTETIITKGKKKSGKPETVSIPVVQVKLDILSTTKGRGKTETVKTPVAPLKVVVTSTEKSKEKSEIIKTPVTQQKQRKQVVSITKSTRKTDKELSHDANRMKTPVLTRSSQTKALKRKLSPKPKSHLSPVLPSTSANANSKKQKHIDYVALDSDSDEYENNTLPQKRLKGPRCKSLGFFKEQKKKKGACLIHKSESSSGENYTPRTIGSAADDSVFFHVVTCFRFNGSSRGCFRRSNCVRSRQLRESKCLNYLIIKILN